MLKIKKATSKRYPLVVSVPHAGTEIPDETKADFCTDDPLILTADSDLFVDRLYQAVPEAGGHLLSTTVCRYVIDPNRDPEVYDSSFVECDTVLDDPPHLGIVAHKTMTGIPLLKAPIKMEAFKKRMADYYWPFHNTLRELIDETIHEFGYCIHIEGHSMPSRGAAGHPDAGKERADADLGDRHGTSCHPKMTQFIADHFTKCGYKASHNSPYRGGYNTFHYGKPDQNCHTIQIELNRKIYMDEKTHDTLPGKFDDVQKVITDLVYGIRDLKLNY